MMCLPTPHCLNPLETGNFPALSHHGVATSWSTLSKQRAGIPNPCRFGRLLQPQDQATVGLAASGVCKSLQNEWAPQRRTRLASILWVS